MIELVEKNPELFSFSEKEFRQRVSNLRWEAEGLMDQVNSIECDVIDTRTVCEIIYGED